MGWSERKQKVTIKCEQTASVLRVQAMHSKEETVVGQLM